VIKASANTWMKSSHSNGQGNCVEVKYNGLEMVSVRDSKNIGPELTISGQTWLAFVRGIRQGELDLSD
jgi:hypothetical protein